MSAVLQAPLASPMHFDPHESQLSFGALGSPTNNPLPLREPLFMGLDLSTQALKACFANPTLDVIAEYSVRFDEDLPEFGTKNGVHMSDDGTVTSPVMMFLRAIDLLFERITASSQGKKLLSQTVAVSGAAQQHATVYWSYQAEKALSSLTPRASLADQLSSAFSSQVSPNWQDSSTTAECREMESMIGGEIEMAMRTGSRAHERFSGPQIMKLRKHRPEVYRNTSRISLVSSFLTTILCGDGRVHSMEESDACGTNLWDLKTGKGWDNDLLSIVAGGNKESEELRNKLGPVEVDGGVAAGRVSNYLVQRYGFNPDALVNHVTGDNNATLLSFSLLTGEVVASLGTSDTILLSTTDYAPSPESHVFSYPANRAGGKRSYMAMLCYKNGSLPREHIRDTYNSSNWDNFSRAIQEAGSPRSSEEALTRPLGFYFLKPEIIPHNGYGIHRFDRHSNNLPEFDDPKFNSRAVLESQFLSFRTRVAPMMASATASSLPNRVYAVGGGSANTSMLEVLSTVLGAPVYKPRTSSVNSCAVGGCLKAYWCWSRSSSQGGDALTFEDAIALARKGQKSEAELVAEPDLKASQLYGEMESRFKACEAKCIRA